MENQHFSSITAPIAHARPSAMHQLRRAFVPGVTPTSVRQDIAAPATAARVVNARQKVYCGVTASLVDYRIDGPMELPISTRTARMVVLIEEVGDRAEIRSDPRFQSISGRGAAQNISVLRPGEPAFLCAQRLCFLRLLTLSFDDEVHHDRACFSTRHSFSDPSLQRLAELFAADLLGSDRNDHGDGFGEGLITPLLSRLGQLAVTAPQPQPRGGLVSWQIRRISELMQAQLSQPLPLQQLAASIGMSRSHFCRAFRASVGMPPHQWHLQMRVARTKELLLAQRMPMSAIALTVGFADQAHFNRTFRRAVGMTPGVWQRSNVG